MSDLLHKAVRPPLALGTVVKPWGEIIAIGNGARMFGERYYFLIDKDGCVSMMPADVVETERDER